MFNKTEEANSIAEEFTVMVRMDIHKNDNVWTRMTDRYKNVWMKLIDTHVDL